MSYVEDHNADWRLNNQIGAVFPVTLRRSALFAVLRLPNALISEVEQAGDVPISAEYDVSSASSVAAVGSAARDVLFASKAGAPVAALAAYDLNRDFVYKHDSSNVIFRRLTGDSSKDVLASLPAIKKGGGFYRPLVSAYARRAEIVSDVGGVDDVDATTVLIELNDAVDERIDGVVVAETDALAGSPARSALTDDNGAGLYRLSTVNFDPATLTVRIATVAAGALTFLVSHCATFKPV